MLREALLTLAAVGGVICIILTILAFTGGYSLIMFKTGSMSPTIPAGSVALVQRIPASEIRVDDVVTVDRAGQLPITHRVTNVAPGSTTDARVIRMKGDANESEDPTPYAVTEGRIVRGSVPALAHVIVWFGSPWVLGSITIGAALLVTWAFWPRTPPVRVTSETAPAAYRTRRERRLSEKILSFAAMAGAIAASTLIVPAPAKASQLVSITSNTVDGTVHALDRVHPFNWDVDIDAGTAPTGGNLTVTLLGAGRSLEVTTAVKSCTMAWDASGCAGRENLVASAAPLLLDGSEQGLLDSPTPVTVHLRVAVTGGGSPDGMATLTLRATAAQTTVDTDLGDTMLPATGGVSLGLIAAPSALLIGIGAALVVAARRKVRR